MIGKIVGLLLVLAVVAVAAAWLLTQPTRLVAGDLPAHQPDVANG